MLYCSLACWLGCPNSPPTEFVWQGRAVGCWVFAINPLDWNLTIWQWHCSFYSLLLLTSPPTLSLASCNLIGGTATWPSSCNLIGGTGGYLIQFLQSDWWNLTLPDPIPAIWLVELEATWPSSCNLIGGTGGYLTQLSCVMSIISPGGAIWLVEMWWPEQTWQSVVEECVAWGCGVVVCGCCVCVHVCVGQGVMYVWKTGFVYYGNEVWCICWRVLAGLRSKDFEMGWCMYSGWV